MSAISFERTAHAKESEIWFAGEVPVNDGLVAVIGNKGSGKSALADIFALVGDTGLLPDFPPIISRVRRLFRPPGAVAVPVL